VLFNFACHPVSLHSYRNLIAPDYPGYARRIVRDVLGHDVVVMFTLGTAGDINPSGYVAGKTTPQRSRQIGTILGCEVSKVALTPNHCGSPELRVRRKVLDLPLEPLPPPGELQEIHERFAKQAQQLRDSAKPWAEISEAEIHRDWARDALGAINAGDLPGTVQCEIQAIRLGETVMLAAPLEIFTETGVSIKDTAPAGMTAIISNSNGAIGYLPTRDAYERRDYTNPQGLAPRVYGLFALARDSEPIFRRAVLELIEEVFG
jgi:hypothetical protein